MTSEQEKSLRWMARYARLGKIEKMLECISDFDGNWDVAVDSGYTVLGEAVMASKSATVKALLDCGAKVSRIDIDPEGSSALMHAARVDCRECAEILIDGGANPDQKNKDGRTALDIARSCQSVAVEAFLSSLAADSDEPLDATRLKRFDAELADLLIELSNKALSCGVPGRIQASRPKSAIPHWYRLVLEEIPFAGIEFICLDPVVAFERQGRFYEIDQLDSYKEDAPYLIEIFAEKGLCPISDGEDGNYWVIEQNGTCNSPVYYWDNSGMESVLAFDNFPEFIRGIKLPQN